MVRDVSWCVVMVHDVLWCVVMVRDVSSWFMMCRDVSWCFIVMVSSWFVMFHCHGFVMVRHGSSCFVMFHCHGFIMVHRGLSWFVMFHCHGFVMVCHGSWCVILKNSPEEGHVTLYLANQGLKFTIKSHFWWDFLFSPFHLKSIPLKSSAKNPATNGLLCSHNSTLLHQQFSASEPGAPLTKSWIHTWSPHPFHNLKSDLFYAKKQHFLVAVECWKILHDKQSLRNFLWYFL